MRAKSERLVPRLRRLALALGGLLYTTLAKAPKYYKHVDEVMAEPAAGKGSAAAARLRRRQVIERKPDYARVSLPDRKQRQGRPGPLHGRRPRHVQGRIRSRPEGHARPRRLRRRAERRDGEMPIEIRTSQRRRCRRLGWLTPSRSPSCLHLETFSSSQRSSRAPTRSRHRSPARAADRRASIESGIGAFYLVAALMTVASAVLVHAFVTNNYSHQVRPALFGCGAAARLQDRLVLGRARRLDDVLGVPARRSSARSPSTRTAIAIAS